MTKKFHKCEKCKGKNGVYVKICVETGEIIGNYKTQLKDQIKDLYSKE